MAMRAFSRLVNYPLSTLGFQVRRIPPPEPFPYPEASAEDISLIEKFSPYTMAGKRRQWSLLKAVDYIDANSIPGEIVECGVWRGGNMMMAAARRNGRTPNRKVYLYDTFAGMSQPSEADVAYDGEIAKLGFADNARETHNEWCFASLEDVNAAFAKFRLEGAVFIKGKVEETLSDPANVPDEIAILRLDTDWYESTKAELDILYPRLAKGGVLIVDDYGHWKGARHAVDEYFSGRSPMFTAIDYTCRVAIKA